MGRNRDVYVDDFNSWTQEHNNLRDPINRSILSLYGLHVMGLEQEQFMKTMKALGSDAAELESDEPLNVVVVIGESYIKQHAQIYGYQLQTTPNMKREEVKGNLFAFQNVVAPTPSTSFTIKNVLCINSISNNENWADTPYFPTLFRKAGYDVYLWDNQRSMEPDSVYTFALNSFLYGKEISEMTYTKTNDKTFAYDAELIASLDTSLLKAPRNLIIYHLMGQHFVANERYPQEQKFLHFTIDSIKRNEAWMTDEKRQSIADYDNATYYNDYILNELFNLYRNSNTILVYFSDHGEEMYDYRDSSGRSGIQNMDARTAHQLFDIPFVIWCSDTYIKRHTTVINYIRKALQRPFSLDNLGQVLFNLGSIKTKCYKPERDLINPKFVPTKRKLKNTLNNTTFDYDEMVAQ